MPGHITPWKPGQSGNPNGRPKKKLGAEALINVDEVYDKIIREIRDKRLVADVADLAKRCGEEAISTLRTIMIDPKIPPPTRVGAAGMLLDRGYGRPRQDVDVRQVIGFHDLSGLTDQQLMQLDFLVGLIEENAAKAKAAEESKTIEGTTNGQGIEETGEIDD